VCVAQEQGRPHAVARGGRIRELVHEQRQTQAAARRMCTLTAKTARERIGNFGRAIDADPAAVGTSRCGRGNQQKAKKPEEDCARCTHSSLGCFYTSRSLNMHAFASPVPGVVDVGLQVALESTFTVASGHKPDSDLKTRRVYP
jgi:hypothetical protein